MVIRTHIEESCCETNVPHIVQPLAGAVGLRSGLTFELDPGRYRHTRESHCMPIAITAADNNCRPNHRVQYHSRGMMLNMNAKSKWILAGASTKGKLPLFTIVGGVVLINPAFAQNPQPQARGSDRYRPACQLEISPDIKRDAHGVVDAISAEDIGKFPDTNLAESLAAYHRHLHRAPRRRRRAGHGARLRPAVQHGHAQRPPDARR